jgi:ubiquinone/menaquinone biosynthesis C-methylase UbiE
MSSPIAIFKKNSFKKILVNFHQKISHNTRIDQLSKLISDEIKTNYPSEKPISCLDVGCGDMTIAESIAKLNPLTIWNCIDIHDLPEELKKTDKWKKYRKFDGSNIPFEDNAFDIVIFCDVLHHTPDQISTLLKEAGRISKYVIIKDHFEYSWYSRSILRLMDFIGNWSYGISIPEKYFTEDNFELKYSRAGLKKVHIKSNINLYNHIPFLNLIIRPKWQFIAVLKSSSSI